MCGICGHGGPEHAVALAPGESLPKPGQPRPRCVDQCARCRDEVREQQARQ
ncbi:hypothetical protein OG345_40745 (plasmid) [Streptomyces sp. NBC_01220]|uniref:hypothetical protein n=1 Tax=Streptomyces sp. NBC_01220 TaxID=2903781 RepID=UPI002F90872C|nr:hypothetical protein OG345_40745 [Streptomyces sp. NBC_01220]